MANKFAPAGTVFVCAACGKTSDNLYGEGARGWDESCMLNAVLCDEKRRFDKNGLLVYVPADRRALTSTTGEER